MRFLSRVWILLVAVGVVSLLRLWREQSRPGTRHYLKGVEYMQAGDPSWAEREWFRGTEEDPKDYRCFKELGDYYARERQFLLARECYESAARLAPRRWSFFVKLAAAERELGHGDAARAAAQRAAELRPDNADAVGLYGLLLADGHDRPAALAMLRRAHELSPDDRQYFIAMIQTEMDSMDYAGVERDLSPYLPSHPSDAEAYSMMAVVFNQKPRTAANLKTAIQYAEKALAGMPRDARVYTLLGQLYLDAGRTGDALRICERGRQIAPNSEGILRSLIDGYTRLGRTADAAAVSRTFQRVLARHDRISHLTLVLGFNHQDTAAGLELARLGEEDGRYAEAQAFYEQLVRQAPADLRMRAALSGFYRRMGWPDRARRALQPQFVP